MEGALDLSFDRLLMMMMMMMMTPCSRTLVIVPLWGVTLKVYQVDMGFVYQHSHQWTFFEGLTQTYEL